MKLQTYRIFDITCSMYIIKFLHWNHPDILFIFFIDACHTYFTNLRREHVSKINNPEKHSETVSTKKLRSRRQRVSDPVLSLRPIVNHDILGAKKARQRILGQKRTFR